MFDNRIFNSKNIDNGRFNDKNFDNEILDNEIFNNKNLDNEIFDNGILNNRNLDNRIFDNEMLDNKSFDNKIIENKLIYVWISKLKIPNHVKLNAIKKLGGIHEFFKASLDDLVYLNLSEKYINCIMDKKLKMQSLYDLEYMQKNKIDIIGAGDVEYPEKLKNIDDNPICFYIRGNKNILNNLAMRNYRS